MSEETRVSFLIAQKLKKVDLVCAEIGVWIGKNAYNMLSFDPTMKIHLVDDYSNIGVTDDMSEGPKEEVREKARKRLEPFKDRITFVYKQSEVAYADYPDNYFDYVYIDGDHSYWGCYRDIKIWYPKVKKGGMLAGHDCAMSSVSKAVLDFATDLGILAKTSRLEGGSVSDWWIFKS